MVMRFVGL